MNELSTKSIKDKIYTIRDTQVMLDKDLAELYGVKPIRLREQVKRNKERFPNDFMFVLSENEVDFMVSQFAIPSKQHLGGAMPMVFTEQGIYMLATILKSPIATQASLKDLGKKWFAFSKLDNQSLQILQRLESRI